MMVPDSVPCSRVGDLLNDRAPRVICQPILLVLSNHLRREHGHAHAACEVVVDGLVVPDVGGRVELARAVGAGGGHCACLMRTVPRSGHLPSNWVDIATRDDRAVVLQDPGEGVREDHVANELRAVTAA